MSTHRVVVSVLAELRCVRSAPTKSKSSLVDRKTREAAQRQEMLEMDELLNR